MELVYLWTLQVLVILESGKMINSMEEVKKLGIKVKLNILVVSIRGKRMVKGDLNGKMDHIMKETLLMDTSKDKENITLLILIKYT